MQLKHKSFVLLAACSALFCAQVRADVMAKVPASALFAIKINNLQATSDKIAAFATDCGFTVEVPELENPLGKVKEEMGISAGLNEAGEAALVGLTPAEGEDEPAPMALLPVSDFDAFIGNFEKVGTEGDLVMVKIKNNAKTWYVAKWGDYAALAEKKELVAAAPAATLKLPAVTAKQAAAHDFIFYSNIPELGKLALPEMKKGFEEIRTDMKKESEKLGEWEPLADAAVNLLQNAGEAFFRDAEAAAIGLSVNPTGISVTTFSEFKADSYLAKFTSQVKNSEKPLLVGLPAGSYLLTMGSVASPELLKTISSDIIDPLASKIPADEKYKPIKDIIESSKTLLGEMKSFSVGVPVPTGRLNEGAIIQTIGFIGGDGAKLKAGFKDMASSSDALNNLMGDLMEGVQPGAGASMKSKSTYKENAKTIAGVEFDSSTTALSGEGPEVEQAKTIVRMIYGTDQPAVYIGSTDQGLVTFSEGVPVELAESLVATAKAGDAPVNANDLYKVTGEGLPKARAVEYYIGVDRVAATTLRYVRQMGLVRKTPKLRDTAPLGFSVASEGTALRIDTFVPTDLIKEMYSLYLYYNAPQGGGGGGL
jgi:hypothetical protein